MSLGCVYKLGHVQLQTHSDAGHLTPQPHMPAVSHQFMMQYSQASLQSALLSWTGMLAAVPVKV